MLAKDIVDFELVEGGRSYVWNIGLPMFQKDWIVTGYYVTLGGGSLVAILAAENGPISRRVRGGE